MRSKSSIRSLAIRNIQLVVKEEQKLKVAERFILTLEFRVPTLGTRVSRSSGLSP